MRSKDAADIMGGDDRARKRQSRAEAFVSFVFVCFHFFPRRGVTLLAPRAKTQNLAP